MRFEPLLILTVIMSSTRVYEITEKSHNLYLLFRKAFVSLRLRQEPKGKQATKGKKQIAEENKSTLNFYLYIIGGANVVYYAVWYLIFWDAFTTGPVLLSALCASIYFGSYQFMARMGKSVYHEGQLVDSGIDLNMESGMAEHTKDLILLTAIVQTLSLLSGYFWLFLLLAPGRLLYMLWANFIGPWFFSSAEPQQVDEKKQKKMERKMKRQQVYR